MKSNIKKLWIGILILAIACLATIACVIGVKASNVVDENILNLEENANTVKTYEIAVEVPVINQTIFSYTGQNIEPSDEWFDNYDLQFVRIISQPQREVGKYNFLLELQHQYIGDDIYYPVWNDSGDNSPKQYSWEIIPHLVDANQLKADFNVNQGIYDGHEKVCRLSVDTSIKDISSYIEIIGEKTGVDARQYNAIARIYNPNFVWRQTNSNEIDFIWRIAPQPVYEPQFRDITFEYDGSERTLEFYDFNYETMNISGNKAIDAGVYRAIITLKSTNYCWASGNPNNLEIRWEILPKYITLLDIVKEDFIYNGNPQAIEFTAYDTTAITITGNEPQVNAGSYRVVVSLKSKHNYIWDSGSISDYEFFWNIFPKPLTKPSITGNLTYNGSTQTIAINNFDAATMNVSGNTGTNAGNYSATISLMSTQNYRWSDNTNANFTLNWSIARKSVAQPTALANSVFVHTGSNLSYIPNGFDTSQMNIQGNVQSAVGKYTASVTPNSNHMWSNGATSAVTFDFEIIPAGITLKQNVYLDYIYNDNGIRKSYGVTYRHKLNDSELNIVNGETRYILGNIKAGTSIGDFLQSLLTDSSLLVIKDVKGNVLYDGLNNIADLNKLVATGYEVILYKDNTGAEILDRVYLSVLGDLTGDGQINSADMAMLNRIISHEIDITSYSLELQLATMLNNNGMLSNIDKEIMHNIVIDIDGNENYFAEKEQISDYVIFELNGNKRVSKTLTTSSLIQGAVVGNISQGTTANEFISKMQAQGVNISLSDMHRANNASLSENDLVGTGCYFTYNGNKVYLTILGDLTGDGRVNSQDRLVINKVVSGNKKFDDMIKAVKLACLINNNGAVTSTDSEIVWQSIIGAVNINSYI